MRARGCRIGRLIGTEIPKSPDQVHKLTPQHPSQSLQSPQARRLSLTPDQLGEVALGEVGSPGHRRIGAIGEESPDGFVARDSQLGGRVGSPATGWPPELQTAGESGRHDVGPMPGDDPEPLQGPRPDWLSLFLLDLSAPAHRHTLTRLLMAIKDKGVQKGGTATIWIDKTRGETHSLMTMTPRDFTHRVCQRCGYDFFRDDLGGRCPSCERVSWWKPLSELTGQERKGLDSKGLDLRGRRESNPIVDVEAERRAKKKSDQAARAAAILGPIKEQS